MRTVILFGMITIAKSINMELIANYSGLFKTAILIAIVLDLMVEFRNWHRDSK